MANNINQISGFSDFVDSAKATMSQGIQSARDKMPSSQTMRSTIVRGGRSLNRSLSSAKTHISDKYESVKGGQSMTRAGERVRSAGRSTQKFCSTMWQKSAPARGQANKFFRGLGFRHYNSVAEFFIRIPKDTSSEPSTLIANQDKMTNGWSPKAVFNNKPLLTSMADWATAKRSELRKGDPQRTSLNPIHALDDISRLDSQGHLETFSGNFDKFIEKYLPKTEGMEGGGAVGFLALADNGEDSYELNVNDGVKAKGRELFDVPHEDRDADWQSEAMDYLKGDLLDGLDSESTFSEQTGGSLTPVLFYKNEHGD